MKSQKGGVQLVYDADEVGNAAADMLNDHLVTKQTGADGRICNSVMVTERKYTRKEYYLAFMNERAFGVSHKWLFIVPGFFVRLQKNPGSKKKNSTTFCP